MSKKMKPVSVDKPISQLTQLEITCKSTRCDANLHSFHLNKTELKKLDGKRVCKDCGVDLIDWERVRKRNLKDSNFTIESLNTELFRSVFWNNDIIEPSAISKANKLSNEELREKAKKIIKQKIGKAKNFREGFQTEKTGNEITHYAQHATGTCCRPCLDYWHGIKEGKELTENELDFCADMAMLYINKKVPKINVKL